jgi:hypothetical protein
MWRQLGYRIGLKPREIDNSTGVEILLMWDGYEHRRRERAHLFALQTFHTLALFSKDIKLETLYKVFGVSNPDED